MCASGCYLDVTVSKVSCSYLQVYMDSVPRITVLLDGCAVEPYLNTSWGLCCYHSHHITSLWKAFAIDIHGDILRLLLGDCKPPSLVSHVGILA